MKIGLPKLSQEWKWPTFFLRRRVVVRHSFLQRVFTELHLLALCAVLRQRSAINVRWYILLRTCAVIISDSNGDKFVKIGQQKPKILQSKSGMFLEHSVVIYTLRPSCGTVCCNRSCLCVCLWVGGSVTTITRNCVHRSSPNWVWR